LNLISLRKSSPPEKAKQCTRTAILFIALIVLVFCYQHVKDRLSIMNYKS
jgi:hypothetical protein